MFNYAKAESIRFGFLKKMFSSSDVMATSILIKKAEMSEFRAVSRSVI